MRDLFDEIVRHGEVVLERLEATRQQEAVDLDFKLKDDPASGAPSRKDIGTFGEMLSAFSNSAGGLLVLGVDARKGADDEVDRVQNLRPVADVERFRSELVRLSGQILMPRHDGIRVEAIPSTRLEQIPTRFDQ